MPPVKCAPSNSYVPPTMVAVVVRLKDRAREYLQSMYISATFVEILSQCFVQQNNYAAQIILSTQLHPFILYVPQSPSPDTFEKTQLVGLLHMRHCDFLARTIWKFARKPRRYASSTLSSDRVIRQNKSVELLA